MEISFSFHRYIYINLINIKFEYINYKNFIKLIKTKVHIEKNYIQKHFDQQLQTFFGCYYCNECRTLNKSIIALN